MKEKNWFMFYASIKEIHCYKVYLYADTKKKALEKMLKLDVDDWGKDLGSETECIIEVLDEDLKVIYSKEEEKK